MCVDEKLTGANEVYYFEGDYWPQQLEEFIKEVKVEEQERRREEEQEVGVV